MKTYNDFKQASVSEVEYKLLISTCRTVEAVSLFKQDGTAVYNERVSKTEVVRATTLENAFKKFENSDVYILFAAKNKEYKLFKFYISPDRRLHRFVDKSQEIFDVYKESYSVTVLEYLYKYYQESLKNDWLPSSIFSDYFLQESEKGFLPPDVDQIEKNIIENCTEATRNEYYSLVKNSCTTPEKQMKVSRILHQAANEERDKNRPISTNVSPWAIGLYGSNAFYSPSLAWALKATEQNYPPAYYWVGILMGSSCNDLKYNGAMKLALILHAALLGDTKAQTMLASEHASDLKSPELPHFVDHNPELAKFWFNIVISKDDPESYESIALYYCRILNKDYQKANSYYQKLVDLGKEEYYAELIPGLVSSNFEAANKAFDKLLQSRDSQVLKKTFQTFELYDEFKSFTNRNAKFELANKIVQLCNDVSYYAYLAEHHYLKGDIASFKKCLHVILGSSDVKAISKAYNLFQKTVFLNLKDIALEIEFITNAVNLGNSNALTLLRQGYKKGMFGKLKHSRDWAKYKL